MPNRVLPKAELNNIYWADGSNSTFVILLSSSAEMPRLWQYPNVRDSRQIMIEEVYFDTAGPARRGAGGEAAWRFRLSAGIADN